MPGRYKCSLCPKEFFSSSKRKRHEDSVHRKVTFSCSICSKTYSRNDNLKRHMKTHAQNPIPSNSAHGGEPHSSNNQEDWRTNTWKNLEVIDDLCAQILNQQGGAPVTRSQKQDQDTDIEVEPEDQNIEIEVEPEDQNIEIEVEPEDQNIEIEVEPEENNNESNDIDVQDDDGSETNDNIETPDGSTPWVRDDGSVDDKLKLIYKNHMKVIFRKVQQGKILTEYNYHLPTGNVDVNELNQQLLDIFQKQQRAFKLNLSLGVILRHRETGELRYFYPQQNNLVFASPLIINVRQDIDQAMDKLREADFVQEAFQTRPDTKWEAYRITNIRWTVTEMDFPLGAGIHLPRYLKKHKAIVGLEANEKTGKPYKDKMCSFRCLAYHNSRNLRKLPIKKYVQKWKEVTGKRCVNGVAINDFILFEDTFGVNVNIYNLDHHYKVTSVFRSAHKYASTMNLNLYKNHLSYVKCMKSYCKKYQCQHCLKLFKRVDEMKVHEGKCRDFTYYKFPGGLYESKVTLFDQLEKVGFNVRDRIYPYVSVFDFEAMQQKCEKDGDSAKLSWLSEHVPVSVSICSNLPDFTEECCFVNENLDELLKEMFQYLEHIQKKAKSLMYAKFKWVLDGLKSRIARLEEIMDTLEQTKSNIDKNNEFLIKDITHKFQARESESKHLMHLLQDTKTYLSQLPVCGYNSSKYDINLVKKRIANYVFGEEDERNSFVVKKGSAYSCLATPKFKLLDIINYVSPGYSYDQFLKAYDVEVRKSHFPYDWFDCIEKLDCPSLPPYEAFYSKLKGQNTLEMEHSKYQELLKSCSPKEALRKMKLTEVPPTGMEVYQKLQQTWVEHEMSTFKDWLVYYNNLDVAPFVKAIEKMQAFYTSVGVDLFKDTISVPGVARELLLKWKDPKADIFLFNESNKNVFMKFKNNIVGGPSIIFHRYHKSGETNIRNGEIPCKTIKGYDANALYLWSISQPMPTGPFTVRREETGFKKEKQDRFVKEMRWLKYIEQQEGKPMKRQQRVGPYVVDGMIGKTIYEFSGCYWHRHQCWMTKHVTDEEWLTSVQKHTEREVHRRRFLEAEGYTVVEMRECEFEDEKKANPNLRDFLDQFKRHCDAKTRMSEDEILKAVSEEKMFGAVEVDIHVPEEKMEYFSEMSPLFCTSEIPFESIGKHMENHAKERNLSQKPRKLLVGGLKAKKILLATPLLKWYMDHGLVVEKVYSVIEYDSMPCFADFCERVTAARRAADVDSSKAIVGESMKLIGNSAYGSLIMDKFKHLLTLYCFDEYEARRKVNMSNFRRMEELSSDAWEIQMSKTKVNMNLPVQLGFFILQYAKLRMLQFYYDFLDKFVARENFQMIEMDTDSAYFALAYETLDEAIRPDLREEYQQTKHLWLPRTDSPQNKAFDKRKPGLFKLEFEGTEMAALASKTYCVHDASSDVSKFSMKGINKSQYKHPMGVYKDVLSSQNSRSGQVLGFRLKNNAMHTYSLDRSGFGYFYCKRRVLRDGVSTAPLDIVLSPPQEQLPKLVRRRKTKQKS